MARWSRSSVARRLDSTNAILLPFSCHSSDLPKHKALRKTVRAQGRSSVAPVFPRWAISAGWSNWTWKRYDAFDQGPRVFRKLEFHDGSMALFPQVELEE